MKRFAILTLLYAGVWLAFSQRDDIVRAWQAQPEVPSGNPAEAPPSSVTPPAAAVKPDPPIDPEVGAAAAKLLRDARDRLYNYETVRAKVAERSTLGNRRFSAEGTYVTGKFPRLRLEFRVRVGDSEGTLIEVCDGQVLRTTKEIRKLGAGGSPGEAQEVQVTRKDVEKILRATELDNMPVGAIQQAELGLGGLPTLLTSLERTLDFEASTRETWQGRPIIVLQGRWKEEYLRELGSQLGEAASALGGFMPDRVRVCLEEESLFPTRILYLKRVTNEPVTYRALLSLELTDVQIDQPVRPDEFRYVPPRGVNEVDETALYLKMIEAMKAQPGPPGSGTATSGAPSTDAKPDGTTAEPAP